MVLTVFRTQCKIMVLTVFRTRCKIMVLTVFRTHSTGGGRDARIIEKHGLSETYIY